MIDAEATMVKPTRFFREYYRLYSETLWGLLSSIGWKEVILAIISLVMGSLYYGITRGWGTMVNEAVNFIVYSLAPVLFLVLIFTVSKLLETPVRSMAI